MSTETLTTIALGVLEEAMHASRKAPVEPGLGLRFAVAYLYAISDDRVLAGQHPRAAFEAFLAEIAITLPRATPHMDGVGRSGMALAHLNHIKRRVGRVP